MRAIEEFIEAFDVRLSERVPGKCLEVHPWPDVREQVLFRADYPSLYRAVKRVLDGRK